jgi:vesicle-associated membrane protein 7
MLRDGLTYLCFATAEKKTAVCFSFLDEIRLKFLGTYDMDVIAKAMAYSTSFLDFKRVLKEEMAKWGAVEFSDAKIENVSRKIDKVKDTMKGNIDKLWERDSQIEDLLEKTELLETESQTFKTNTKKLASHFWWKNFKIWLIIIIVLLVLGWLIASLICGFQFQCLKHGSNGQAGGTHTSCFHVDSHISVHGRKFLSMAELQDKSECYIPHVFEAKGEKTYLALSLSHVEQRCDCRDNVF